MKDFMNGQVLFMSKIILARWQRKLSMIRKDRNTLLVVLNDGASRGGIALKHIFDPRGKLAEGGGEGQLNRIPA